MRSFCLAATLLFATTPALAQSTAELSEQQREEAAYQLGVQTYLWGAPLVDYGATLTKSLLFGVPIQNNLYKFTMLKTARSRFVVTPNNVTIDAYGAFDVTDEPVVLVVPKLTEPRYYLAQLGNAFDEIFLTVGGVQGPRPGVYLITGPNYLGEVPAEMTRVPSRTRIGGVAVRMFVSGQADLPAAVEAQRGFYLMPLSAYQREALNYQPPLAMPQLPRRSDAPPELRFFDELGHWMTRALPQSAAANDPQVAVAGQIGLSATQGFQWQSLDEPTRLGLARAAVDAHEIVDDCWQSLGEVTAGWRYTFSVGRAGHNPTLRAALARYMLGGQLAEEVLYPNTRVDAHDDPLTGRRKYVLHFPADALPPVSVFWNLSLYGDDMLFVPNDFNRYSLGSTTDGLRFNDDGSLTIYIQHERPAEKHLSNWLPAPAGSFNLTMRLYGPAPAILDGSYRLPAVERAD